VPFEVVDRYGENRMIEKPTIVIVLVGVIPPNVLAELGATVATSVEAKVIVAPSIPLALLRSTCAESRTTRRRFFRRWPPFCALPLPWAECCTRDRSCRSSLALEDGAFLQHEAMSERRSAAESCDNVSMPFSHIAEKRIREAIEQGQFENLPGAGQPLNLEEYFSTPEEVRMAYSILKNANCAPVEVELVNDVSRLEQTVDVTARESLQRELTKR
jgi:hypothetical protein